MKLCIIDRVKDEKGIDTHAATITTDTCIIHADFFPYMPVGMEFEEEEVFVNNTHIKAYMPTDLGVLKNTFRKTGENMDKESSELNDIDRSREDALFYYSVKDFISYPDILNITYSDNKKGVGRSIYSQYLKSPYVFICSQTDKYGEELYSGVFPDLSKVVITKTFEERLTEYRYGARYILKTMEHSGDTWMPYSEFKEKFLSLFKSIGKPMRVGNPRAILEYFDDFDIDPVISGDAKVSLKATKMEELDILEIINGYRKVATPFPAFNPGDIDDFFTTEQVFAIKNAIICKGRISIITGGPGTGKTTVLKKIIYTMKENYPDVKIKFLASTGKAANRIKETLGDKTITVSTVHKFLGIGNNFYSSKKRETDKEIKQSGLIIVDESSMTDVKIFSMLLNKLDMQKTKIILVGDCDQLPSVECGNILSDLIALDIPCYYLKENHRNNGVILSNAQKIIEGDPFLFEDEHFRIVEESPSIGWMNAAIRTACDDIKMNTEETDEDKEIAVFSPYRREEIDGSSYHMNNLIQSSIFKGNTTGRCSRFFIGDKVVFTRNNNSNNDKESYYNGDIGIFAGYNRGKYLVSVNGEIKEVEKKADIDLAYSLTIHKSQGSEYDEVRISIPKYTSFITRRMLYTAITRAKEKVTIYASKGTIRRIILNNSDRDRRTYLSYVSKLEQKK